MINVGTKSKKEEVRRAVWGKFDRRTTLSQDEIEFLQANDACPMLLESVKRDVTLSSTERERWMLVHRFLVSVLQSKSKKRRKPSFKKELAFA